MHARLTCTSNEIDIYTYATNENARSIPPTKVPPFFFSAIYTIKRTITNITIIMIANVMNGLRIDFIREELAGQR